MGNLLSVIPRVHLRLSKGVPDHVYFDLLDQEVLVKYDARSINVTFVLPLGLGGQLVSVRDALEIARDGSYTVVSIPVKLEERHRVDRVEKLRDFSQLATGDGFLAGVESISGPWARAGRVDTDLGAILVYGRVSRELKTTLHLELDKRNWLGFRSSWLVARAEGTVQLAVKARFETEADRHPLALLWSTISPFFSAILCSLKAAFQKPLEHRLEWRQ